MSKWKTYKLGDLCEDISYGYTESAAWENIGPKFLRITDIQNDFINWNTVPYCPISKENHTKYKLKVGDIVIARTGASTGVTTIFKDNNIDAVYASYLIRYRINKEKADPFYIAHVLKSTLWRSHVNSIVGGSAQPGANAKQFAAFEFPLPELPTQTQIASILSSLDDKIELHLQMNQTLQVIAQTLFKEWFVAFNFPGFDGRLIDGLPKGWKFGKLNEVCKIEIGRTPPRMEEHWFSTDSKDIKWISIRDLGLAGVYIFNTYEYLTKEAVEKFRIPIIPVNTVVLSFKLTIGRLAITTEPMLSNEAIAQIKSDIFSTEYIFTYLKTYNWGTLGNTSSIATAINSKIIKEMKILIPENTVEKQFQEAVRPIFEKLKANSQEIETLTQIRDNILPQIMTGKIKIQAN